jgi:hypothetical protein
MMLLVLLFYPGSITFIVKYEVNDACIMIPITIA